MGDVGLGEQMGFEEFLKMSREVAFQISEGMQLQRVGAASQKALSPKVRSLMWVVMSTHSIRVWT